MTPREAIQSFLPLGLIDVVVDNGQPDVDLPPTLHQEEGTILQLGYGMPIPMLDLELLEDRLTVTLSFNRRPYRVSVPWGAVLFVGSSQTKRGVVFDSKVKNLSLGNKELEILAPPEVEQRPKLRLLKGGLSED